jgi:hypothetical protein
MKDFRFFRGYGQDENVIDVTQGVITQEEYNLRRDLEAYRRNLNEHERYLTRYYEMQRHIEEARREELNRI